MKKKPKFKGTEYCRLCNEMNVFLIETETQDNVVQLICFDCANELDAKKLATSLSFTN